MISVDLEIREHCPAGISFDALSGSRGRRLVSSALPDYFICAAMQPTIAQASSE